MFCIRKKVRNFDNKVWWELEAKVQSMVDDGKNEFNEDTTNEDVSHCGDCMGFSYIWNAKDCLNMLQTRQFLDDVFKEVMGRIKIVS